MSGFLKSLSEEKKWTGPAAGVLGFLEGSFVVFPMEPLFIPMMAARHARAWIIALWLLFGNVMGAVLMYAVGAFLLEPVAEPLFQFLGVEQEYQKASSDLEENAFTSLFLVGVTPFPFQVGTAAAGAIGVALPVFLAAVSLSRGIRYMALAGLVMVIGARARGFLEDHERAIFIAGLVLFVLLAAVAILGNA
ncbi:MAG: hypothetical protein CMI63_09245 [Parvularcula sp.]|uniref:YqaA family protein n=1 Tax=Hyphococcus sp. TaxID=2038636 RepID=UPI000C44FE06|nr:hypothetical protein [Parvularcula sp.]